MRGPAMLSPRRDGGDGSARPLGTRDGTRDQQFDNSMTHNDSQNALRKRKCDCRVEYIITEIETYTITSMLGDVA